MEPPLSGAIFHGRGSGRAPGTRTCGPERWRRAGVTFARPPPGPARTPAPRARGPARALRRVPNPSDPARSLHTRPISRRAEGRCSLTLLAWLPRADAADLHTGDLVFHRSRTRQSALLARVTGSQWTHVGVVFVQDGTTNVLEAGDPVRFVPFADWAARAADGRIGIRRLAAHPDGLPDDVVSKMEALAASWLGRRYDAAFSWTDDRLYCPSSPTSSSPRRSARRRRAAPVRLVRPLRPAGPGRDRRALGTPPLDEPVIAPSDLYADPRWTAVCEGPTASCR
ncbi:MAG: YiiX/YebB-like N1pC/P60 family cysteine hydrolase [Myxococcota bacterium]